MNLKQILHCVLLESWNGGSYSFTDTNRCEKGDQALNAGRDKEREGREGMDGLDGLDGLEGMEGREGVVY